MQGYRDNHVANNCNFTYKMQGYIAVVFTLLVKFRRSDVVSYTVVSYTHQINMSFQTRVKCLAVLDSLKCYDIDIELYIIFLGKTLLLLYAVLVICIWGYKVVWVKSRSKKDGGGG